MESPASEATMLKVKGSHEYVCAYRDLLLETNAPIDVCMQFDRLVEVLGVVLQMRQQVKLGVLCSYGQLNQRLMCNG